MVKLINYSRPIEATERSLPVEATEKVLNESGKMWAISGTNYLPCDKTCDVLPAGQYTVGYNPHNGSHYFVQRATDFDNLVLLPDNNSEAVIKAVQTFWSREAQFRKYGFIWKRGVLLWGPPGSGKTSTVQQLSADIISRDGIAIYCTNTELDAKGLRTLRNIEPKRPIVFVLEDLDAIVDREGEARLLSMLDGELQIDNIVCVATTNYPEKLDKRFINRPSRFDEIIKISMPNTVCRRVFLVTKNPRLADDAVELENWVESTDGFSIAHLKELIVSVECLGHGFHNTVERLKKMNKILPSSNINTDQSFGFMGE